MNLVTLGVNIDPHGAVAAAQQINNALASVAAAAKAMSAAIATANQAPVAPAAPQQQQALSWWQKMRQSISNFLGGTQQAGQATQQMSQQSQQALNQMSNSAANTMGMFQKLGAVIGAISFAAMLAWIAKLGVEFNSTLEDATVGIAAVQRTFDPGRFQNFNMALEASGRAVEMLKQKAAESPASFESLVGAFQATAGAAAKANLSMRQHVDLIVMMSQALKGLGIADQQIITESRALITGNINADSDAARILGITREDISRATAAGQLADFLTSKMKAFSEAGKAAAGSMSVTFANIQDNFQQLAGEVSKPIFEELKKQAVSFLEVFQGDAGKTALTGIATSIASFAKGVGQMLKMVAENAGAILTWAKYLGLAWVALKAIQLGEFLRMMVASSLAINTSTVALEANAIAATRAAMARKLFGVGAVVGALAAGGSTGTMVGAGIGAFFGPVAMGIGAGLGLLYDKLTEGSKKLNEAVQESIKLGKEQMATMTQQIGMATALKTQAVLRAAAEAKIAELQRELFPAGQAAGKAGYDSPEAARYRDLFNQLGTYQDLLRPGNFGKLAADQDAGAKYAAAADKAFEALRRQIDAAEDLNAKEAANLVLQKAIAKATEDAANAPEKILGQQGQLNKSANEYLATLNDMAKTFDLIAGSHAMQKFEEEQAAKRMEVANRELGETLKMSQAKYINDVATVRVLDDQKRLNELLKALDVDQSNAKENQLKFCKEILQNERDLKEVEARRTFEEEARIIRLRGLDKSADIARLEAAGNTAGADSVRAQQLQSQLAEAQANLAKVQADQQVRLQLAGVKNVPPNATPQQIMDLNSPANGIMTYADAMKLLVPAAKAIGASTADVAAAMKEVADNSRRILEQVPTDKRTMDALNQQIAGMKSSYQQGNMTDTEFARRTDAARDSAANDLANPGAYRQQLGVFRAMSAEKLKISQETDAKIAAGGATMTESLTRGFEKAAASYGNMGTQMTKLAEGISTSISGGIGSALGDIVTGSKSAGDAFRDMAISILNNIAKMIIQMLVELAIAQLLNALGYGGGGQVSGAVRPAAVAIPTGGNSMTGYRYASGGNVSGGMGGIDDIPAMLTAGEYVIRRDSVDKYGLAFLDAINEGRLGKHAEGGSIAARQARGASLGIGTGATTKAGDANITINVDAKGDGNDPQKDKRKAEAMARSLKQTMDAWAVDAKRPGGVLNM